MDSESSKGTGGSAALFLSGLVAGAVGGIVVGWLLSGQFAAILSSILNLASRDSKGDSVRFEVMQQ